MIRLHYYLLLPSLLLFLSLARFSQAADASTWTSNFLSCFKCPTDDSYDAKCLKSVIPPWPMCLGHDVPYWVSKAKDGATRCCKDNGDLSECRCPKKDTEKFQTKIGEWCEDIATCDGITSTGDMYEEELLIKAVE